MMEKKMETIIVPFKWIEVSHEWCFLVVEPSKIIFLI